ncbi:MAG: hypothetical protein ACRC6D_13680, partial [Aeromonas sp.]
TKCIKIQGYKKPNGQHVINACQGWGCQFNLRIPYPVSRIPYPVSRIPYPVSRIPYPVSRIPF